MSQFEQRANIKFCSKLGKTAAETLECLKAVYSDEALKKTAVYDWFKRFKNGQESLENEERSGRPSTSKNDKTIEKVKNLVRSVRRLRIQDMENALGILYGTVQNILKDDLGMRRVCAKFVPRILTAVWQFLTDKKMSTIPQPPYSLDITPCDFWLFPNLKLGLKAWTFFDD